MPDLAMFLLVAAALPLQELRRPATRRLAQTELSGRAILDHARVLAADGMLGRKTASKACRLAGDYIALQMETLGLEPGGSDGYFQPFEVGLGYVPRGVPVLELGGGAGPKALVPRRDFELLGHGGSGDVTASLVFVGYGLSLPVAHAGITSESDDYTDLDVRGKIVAFIEGSPELGGVVIRGGVQRKIYTAKAKGAAAVLYLSREPRGRLKSYEPTNDSAGIPALRVSLEAISKRIPGLDEKIQKYESGRGSTGPLKATLRVVAKLEQHKGTARNVVGFIRGSDPDLAGEVVVLGAHYDHLGLGGDGSLATGGGRGHIHNGADDNASGVAVMLEVARALVRRKKLGRSVILAAFSGEEMGLLGSRHFVEHPTRARERIVAMVNLDMVGRSKEGYVAAIGAGTSPVFPKLLGRIPRGPSVQLNDSSFGGSDHQSFIAQGIPALHFFSGTHSDYHRPSDDVEKLNVQGMQRIGEVVLRLVEELSRLPERPAFVKPKPKPVGPARTEGGPRPYLGTIPDYAEGKGGVKLSGVAPGSPVEKAGVKSGDTLVGLAGKKIDNIYDFSYALQDLRPGQRVTVIVLRDGKRKSLEVVIGSR